MPRTSRRHASLFFCATLLVGAVVEAAPTVAGITVRRPDRVHPKAETAFLGGAAIAVGVGAPKAPGAGGRGEAAIAQVAAGEAAYLAFKLRAAEEALTAAVDGLLSAPAALEDAEPAVRAVLLLAQVQLARERAPAADTTIERALLALPGFPRGGQPPPDISTRIDSVRARLAPRLAARLRLISDPPGAPVRINGVALGKAPLDLDGLPVGPVQVAATFGDTTVRRQIILRPGNQTQRIFESGGAPSGAKAVLEALAGGARTAAMAAAAQLQDDTGAEYICAALLAGGRAYVLRIDGTADRVVGAHAEAAPVAIDDWRKLGGECGPRAKNDVSPDRLRNEVWVRPAPVGDLVAAESGFARSDWGWTAMAGGAAVAGVGVWLGLSANEAADVFNRTGAPADEDRARRDALFADLSYTVAVGLVVTGIYLLVTD